MNTGPTTADPTGDTETEASAKKRRRSSARTRTPIVRRAVLDAAAEIFGQRGFAGTNLRDIADALGMSRPGLYYHFPSKDKLLEALVEEVTLSAERQVKEMALNRSESAELALRQCVEFGAMWIIDHAKLFLLVERSESQLPADLLKRNRTAKREILDYIISVIDRGIMQGLFRPIDSHAAALTIVGMQNWTAWWVRPEGKMPKEAIAKMVAEMAVQSLIRPDAYRSRSDQLSDIIRVLEEDVAHLKRVMEFRAQGSES